ncbi:hypothetical protein [Nonomuraea sp. NPDC049504]|uniref:hypothetical protein n=1 Tax=Nonomuraea sp. NPDC049504 TaxID=3154729 RepID=UPI00341CB1B7
MAMPALADLDAAYEEYAARYRRSWVAFPDVAQAVAGLAGFALGVLTNGVQRVQEAKVRAIGLAGSYGRGARPRGVPAHHLADGAGAAAEGLNRLRRQLDTFVRTF